MRNPLKTYFHPRGNVYGNHEPKYPWLTEGLAWLTVAGLIWVLWKLM